MTSHYVNTYQSKEFTHLLLENVGEVLRLHFQHSCLRWLLLFTRRADYWKSQPRKFCEICKCWFGDNKAVSCSHEDHLETHLLFCLISRLILIHLALSCSILPHLAPYLILPHLASSCLIILHLASICLISLHLASFASSCSILSHLASSYFTLPHLTSSCFVLPHHTSSCLILLQFA